MKSKVGHLQINIDLSNQGFYKELLTFLGWSVIFGDENMLGMGCGESASLWFMGMHNKETVDYDARAVNHIGIQVTSVKDVDATMEYLRERGLEALFDTPRHRKEFSSGGETYYQVMFKSPDNILLEVMYSGPHSE